MEIYKKRLEELKEKKTIYDLEQKKLNEYEYIAKSKLTALQSMIHSNGYSIKEISFILNKKNTYIYNRLKLKPIEKRIGEYYEFTPTECFILLKLINEPPSKFFEYFPYALSYKDINF